jgi:hypothetical protein
MSPVTETIPKIMIFGRRQSRPAAGCQVCIRPHTQVCTVDVRVAPVCMNDISETEPFFYPLSMFGERIDIDDSCDSFKTPLGEVEVTDKPICWNLTISICVGQPTAVKEAMTPFDGRSCSHSARRSHDTGIRLKHKSRIFENYFSNSARSILRAIRNNDYIACNTDWQTPACLLY